MKYLLAIALIPLAILELLLRGLLVVMCVVTVIGMIVLMEPGINVLLRVQTFDLIREVIR